MEYTKDDLSYKAPSPEGRLQKEMDSFALLDKLGIEYAWVSHEVKMTVADCADIDALLEIQINKNLFLRDKAGKHYYLLLMPGEKRFESKVVSKLLGVSRLGFANEEKMEEFMNLTPGSVTILGLMYDKDHNVQLLIDKELLESKYTGMHPCINTTSLRMTTEDFVNKLVPGLGHEPIWLDIPRSEEE